MLHIRWVSLVVRANELWSTYQLRHVTHMMSEACCTYEWGMLHIRWVSHIARANEVRSTYQLSLSHIWWLRRHTCRVPVKSRCICAIKCACKYRCMCAIKSPPGLCRTYEWVFSHISGSHVAHIKNESCRTYKWVGYMSNEACCTYDEWGTSHIWMRHVAHKMNEACHT